MNRQGAKNAKKKQETKERKGARMLEREGSPFFPFFLSVFPWRLGGSFWSSH